MFEQCTNPIHEKPNRGFSQCPDCQTMHICTADDCCTPEEKHEAREAQQVRVRQANAERRIPITPIALAEPERQNPLEPVKTKVRPKAVESLLDDLFPGAHVVKTERLGGYIYEIKVWRYSVKVSVTLESMAEVDKSGDATFTFSEQPDRKPIILKQFTTGDLGELKEGLEDTRSHVMGIVQAITKACNPKPKSQAVNILAEED